MNVRDLIPWGRQSRQTPATYRDAEHPFLSLHRDMNRLFDDFFRDFAAPAGYGGWSGWPHLEVSETEREIRVTAELPGLEEKDVDVTLENGVLTLRGERKSEFDDAERQFSERFYGRFERRLPLDADIEQDNVQAAFRNGVLTVTLPKTAQAQARTRRIPINGGR